MLNVVKYIMALLFVIAGGALFLYKTNFGGGMSIQDWISSALLAVGGAGYILHSLPNKVFGMIKNISLPSFKSNAGPTTSLNEDREALDYLMQLGMEYDNKLIIDSVVKMNDEIFKLRHTKGKT